MTPLSGPTWEVLSTQTQPPGGWIRTARSRMAQSQWEEHSHCEWLGSHLKSLQCLIINFKVCSCLFISTSTTYCHPEEGSDWLLYLMLNYCLYTFTGNTKGDKRKFQEQAASPLWLVNGQWYRGYFQIWVWCPPAGDGLCVPWVWCHYGVLIVKSLSENNDWLQFLIMISAVTMCLAVRPLSLLQGLSPSDFELAPETLSCMTSQLTCEIH